MKRVVLLFSVLLSASPVAAQDKGWLDVNIGGAQSVQGAQVFTFSTTIYQEAAAFSAAYPKASRGADFDFGGGFLFVPNFGVGVSFSGTAHNDIAGLGASVPHPIYSNDSAVGAAQRTPCSALRGVMHFQAVGVSATFARNSG